MFQHSSNPAKRSSFWIATAVGSLLTAQGFLELSQPITTAQFSGSRPTQIDANDDRSNAALALTALGVGVIGFSWARARSSGTQTNATKLDRHLLLLLHQDRAAADRLVTQMQRKHPERSRECCIEKVKYDLERDRH